MNLPNALTLFRLVAVGGFAVLFLQGHLFWAGVCYLLGVISDILDGYVARRTNQVTKVGQVLDPLADKVALATAVLCLWIRGYLLGELVIVVVVREIVMISVGTYAYFRKEWVLPANKWGKLSTVLFSASIVASLFARWIAPWHWMMMAVAIGISLIAFVQYGVTYLKSLKK